MQSPFIFCFHTLPKDFAGENRSFTIINKAIQSVYTGKPMNEIQKMKNADVIELSL